MHITVNPIQPFATNLLQIPVAEEIDDQLVMKTVSITCSLNSNKRGILVFWDLDFLGPKTKHQ